MLENRFCRYGKETRLFLRCFTQQRNFKTLLFHLKRTYGFCLILVLVFLSITRQSCAVEIAVVQSSALKPYKTALTSFQEALTRLPSRCGKSIQPVQYHNIIISDISGPDVLSREIIRHNPDLILAIGRKALAAVINFTDIPIFYMLAPNAAGLTKGRAGITGIDMDVAPEIQLAAVKRLLPQVKLIGVVYNPAQRATFIREAERAARGLGLSLSVSLIHSDREVLRGLKALDPQVDLLWMLPDVYLFSPMGREALFVFSLERKIPVMTFAPKYLKSGALLAVAFDIKGMGKEAAGLVRRFLNGTPISELPPVKTRQAITGVNKKIADRFGLKINHGDMP